MRTPARAVLAVLGTALLGVGLVTAASPARAAVLTLPDLRILVPTNQISIGPDAVTGHRMLRYTHITENAGTGPFELDPNYDPVTGVATFTQALYSSPSAGTWQYDHSVPVAQTGTFSAPADYNFPLSGFTLNTVNADGSTGPTVVTSPKVDYCMTGDTRVGDVPNTPSTTFIPATNCTDPTLPLGWSVGWGDQYDQTDDGQPIDLTGVPDGTYVLRATADPRHVLTESSTANDTTDTTLTISGSTVTVLAQSNPVVALPSVSLAAPADGAQVSGTVSLQATATAPAPATVASVQFLLDGQSLGTAVTTAPYTYSWAVGTTPPGSHTLSARVTDSTGRMATAPVVTVSVAAASGGGPAVDRTVTSVGRGTRTTGAFSTSTAGETLLAFVSSDGPAAAGAQTATVSGAGLVWTLVRRADASFGDSEVWAASAATVLSGVTVTATQAASSYDQQLTVLTLTGAAGVGAGASGSGGTGAPSVSLATTVSGSRAFAVGNDWDAATARTPAAGQTLLSQYLDTATGDIFWTQGTTAPGVAGQPVVMADTAPTNDRWNLAAVEVLPAGTPPVDTAPPVVAISNPVGGQTVSGTQTVSATATDDVAVASVQFLVDGIPLGAAVTTGPYTTAWDTTTAANGGHTLTAVATDTSGKSTTSAAVPVVVANPAPPMTCFVLQTQQSVHGRNAVTTSSFATAMAGEVLVAFVGADGPATANGQTATVSGAGLTWTRVARSNAQYGDAEIWTASAPAVLTAARVTSTLGRTGYDQDLTVIAMEGTSGAGATAVRSAASGAPSVSVATTAARSLVFAVGNDWDRAVARTLPTGDVSLEQYLDTRTGDTFWSEYTNQAIGPAGTLVTIGASASTGDRWNLAAVELRGDGA